MSDRVVVLSHRPAVIQGIHNLEELRDISTIARRNTPVFQTYFNIIWKELDVDV